MLFSQKNRGFTLIELLVVITIIGILTASGLVFFASAQRSSRDARRQADLRAVAQAYEQYFSVNNAYPDTAAGVDTTAFFPSGARPVDPRNVGANVYTYAVLPTGFCVCAGLENLGKGNGTAPAPSSGTTCSFGTPASGAQGYFCVQNQQ